MRTSCKATNYANSQTAYRKKSEPGEVHESVRPEDWEPDALPTELLALDPRLTRQPQAWQLRRHRRQCHGGGATAAVLRRRCCGGGMAAVVRCAVGRLWGGCRSVFDRVPPAGLRARILRPSAAPSIGGGDPPAACAVLNIDRQFRVEFVQGFLKYRIGGSRRQFRWVPLQTASELPPPAIPVGFGA